MFMEFFYVSSVPQCRPSLNVKLSHTPPPSLRVLVDASKRSGGKRRLGEIG